MCHHHGRKYLNNVLAITISQNLLREVVLSFWTKFRDWKWLWKLTTLKEKGADSALPLYDNKIHVLTFLDDDFGVRSLPMLEVD